MLSRMEPDQVCASMRLRQWAYDKTRLRHARASDHTPRGWQQRRDAEFNARRVYVIDIERAIALLPTQEQALLIARYPDHFTEAEIACVAGCSTRKVGYALPEALKHLATILDRLDLL
jgi:DNA-directed RNA polymerase specialized sigma24 family protein